ncbi:MAG: aminodeoxychorismate/anthranilate synthase component II [Polyangiaceae bacterium]
MSSARVLVIDNYDSFTYNLVQLLRVLGATCEVFLHDRIDVAGVREWRPDGVLISPGPCTPDDAGVSLRVVDELAGKIPIFGVCLGHQVITQALGGRVVRAPRLMHGKTSPVFHDGSSVFANVPSPFLAARYHSLIAERDSLPSVLRVTASTDEGEIMGIEHRAMPLVGVQFHPESFLTEHGAIIVGNWLRTLDADDSSGVAEVRA